MADQPESIFETKSQETPDTNAAKKEQQEDKKSDYADLLKQIVNEKGEQKYNSLEDALVGLKHAQEFIPKLKEEKKAEEEELERLRQEIDRLKSLEETVLELTRSKTQPETNGKSLSEEDIANLVQQTLTKTQQAELQKKNITTVVTELRSKFGDEAEKVFYEKAQDLGLTVEEMNALAAKTPKAVLTMLGASVDGVHKQPNFNPTTGSVNTAAFKPKTNTFLGKSNKNVMLGATSQDILEESAMAKNMVEEIHSQGLTVHDLTDPKIYFKYFK